MNDLPGFPSGFSDLLGIEMLEWREGLVRLACTVAPHHLNIAGIIHGGVLMTLLDEAGAAAGVWSPDPARRRLSVTVSITTQFTGQASSGRVVAEGRMVGGGRSIYFSRSEVLDESGRMLGFGSSTHRWRRGSNEVAG